MTLSIAWTRKAGHSHELIVASDSRLTSVGHVDICQKIFPLSRGDSFFAFCGDTIVAFPVIFQLQSAIENFLKAADRTEDITHLLHRVLTLVNAYRLAWSDTSQADVDNTNETTRFLFGGWSWRYGKFFIYPIQYDKHEGRFLHVSSKKTLKKLGLPKGEMCLAIGNYTAEFRYSLRAMIVKNGLQSLNYEPLEILASMLSNPKFTDRRGTQTFLRAKDPSGAIGGAPQALKVYQHLNIRPIAIRWPKADANQPVTLFGRPLFKWENTLHPIYDLESQKFHYPLSGVSNFQ